MTTAELRQPTPAIRGERSGPLASSREASADSRPPPPPYASIAQPIENRPARSRTADALFNHEWAHLGLPTGFFLLRNAAQGKTLDLLSHRQDEGAELGLHPIKQPLLQGVSLQHKGNNQLFCLSWDGHLIAGASSRAVDVEGQSIHFRTSPRSSCDLQSCHVPSADWQLVQAFPHPIMSLPSRLSHPPARFRLDPTTSILHVLFDTDPHYSGPNGSDEWRSYDYIVEAVPRKRKPAGSSAWSAASEQAGQVLSGIGSTAATLGEKLSTFGLFSGRGSASSSQQTSPKLGSGAFTSTPAPPNPAKTGSTSVTASSGPSTAQSVAGPSTQVEPASAGHTDDAPTGRVIHVEQDPEEAPDSDSDSEPAAFRSLRVVRLDPGWREKFPAEALQAAPDKSFGVTRWSSSPKELRKWRRRMWDVIPVTIRRMSAPDFPVHNAERAGGTVPMSAPESRSASASDSHEDGSSPDDDERYTEEEDESVTEQRQQQHLAPPKEAYAMADYFGIGSHETSGASSPVNSRSRRPSAYAAGVTTALSSTVTAASSHLTGLLSSRLLPLSIAPGADTGNELADEEGTDGETTGLQATPRLPKEEWDANVVGSRELDALARERQSSTSAESSSAGEWETDAETPRLESAPPPVRRVQRETEQPPPSAGSTSQE